MSAFDYFLRGIARLLDFRRTLSDYDFMERTDAEALRSDWQAVSNDLRSTFGTCAACGEPAHHAPDCDRRVKPGV